MTQKEEFHVTVEAEIRSVMSKGQGMPRIARNYQKLGRGKEEFSPGAFKESMTLPTLRLLVSRPVREEMSIVLSH